MRVGEEPKVGYTIHWNRDRIVVSSIKLVWIVLECGFHVKLRIAINWTSVLVALYARFWQVQSHLSYWISSSQVIIAT